MASWEDEADNLLEEAEREQQEIAAAAAAAAEAKQRAQQEVEKVRGRRRVKEAAAGCGGGAATATGEVDSLTEKLRRQKIVENEDRRLMDDLFAGCDRPEDYEPPSAAAAAKNKDAAAGKARRSGAAGDTLDTVTLRSYKECEDFALKLGRHIQSSPAKSTAWLRFLDLVVSDCAAHMELKDLVSLQNKLQAKIAAREKQAKQLAEKKKKPNDTSGCIRNYKDEIDLLYGDLSSEEGGEEEEEEEADA